ncbi:polyprenyl synthetase family protein [Domibacillus sp. DTU_2020_1001157_1_SI_ALB_TIR_016]|uniref:polyprenyl synthetase family protein n=1 Tax=Domibacillus sp. DTU_2020_1001157_1_SI_ALB_TIR_016 TaxID=3077789 RepID=UPI0028E42BAA|nr:farnesyl diphosphate synthase [Domibacillus sp. DTU_2020_1001157_1_SI_ALB_TIR_016]WNS81999.1 polyprenyl synthetase family protein [Domibacillus sp. DTU_2020_1001157_1_SI_ALB_TIR_016]
MTNIKTYIEEKLPLFEAHMMERIDALQAPGSLKEAMIYSLKAGGKRIRPMLLFAALETYGKKADAGLDAACALEMIHTYSLIHDDLPAMDDDDLRRGKPTNHKVFGEATAILAGDALLTYAFEVIARSEAYSSEQAVELIRMLSFAAGPAGMVGGQVADMEGEQKKLSLGELEYIHHHKTGRLLAFSVMAGALIGGADEMEKALLETYARHIGLAFQIRDDILDIEGTEEEIGKPVGSDESNEKSTYPSLLTMAGAKKKLEEELQGAQSALASLKRPAPLLEAFADLIAKRTS